MLTFGSSPAIIFVKGYRFMSQSSFDVRRLPKMKTEPKVGDVVAAEPFPHITEVADVSAQLHPHISEGSELAKMAEARRAENAKYEASAKGRAARAKAREKLQVKRTIAQKELAAIKADHQRRYYANPAQFSKQFTVFTTFGVASGKPHGTDLLLPGVGLAFKLARRYGTTLTKHTRKDGSVYFDYLTEIPQCVQAGVPKWRDSILNPRNRKFIEQAGAEFFERARVLRVSLRADAITVRKAYLQLVKRHHPDHGGDPAEFRAVQEAYEAATKG